jgi:DNA-binding CsgD family transcriptional regulator
MTETQKTLIVEMFCSGISMRKIAKHFNTTHNTISRLIREKGIESSYRKNILPDPVVVRYIAGESMNNLAKTYKISTGTVKRILLNNKVKLRKNTLDVDEEIVLQMYRDQSLSSYAIADEIGISQFSVLKILRAHKEVKTVAEAQRKNFFNEAIFKNIDTAFKAYWLGFMFGDGYVKSNLKEFGITLKSEDMSHLEKFAEFLEYSGEIKTYDPIEGAFSNNQYSKLVACSRETCADLISHGCIPNKTHILAEPQGLNKTLFKDFIRGLVDADGGIYVYSKIVSWELVGTYDLLKWVADRLPESARLERHKSIWRIRRAGTPAVNIISWLYAGNGIALDRKNNMATKAMEKYNE